MTHIEYLEKLLAEYKENKDCYERCEDFDDLDYQYLLGGISALEWAIKGLKNGGDFEWIKL